MRIFALLDNYIELKIRLIDVNNGFDDVGNLHNNPA